MGVAMRGRPFKVLCAATVVSVVGSLLLGCVLIDMLDQRYWTQDHESSDYFAARNKQKAAEAQQKALKAQQSASATQDAPASPGDPTADTAGDIQVVWKAESGSARQDPLGLLSGTPLQKDGNHLRAKRTVPFKPNSPNAQSAKGNYVYTLDLVQTADGLDYRGTMTIDWTMTIVWSAASKNEFHAVYKADASAQYDGVSRTLRDGVAKGTAKTTDTSVAGASSIPHKSSAAFTWTFGTP
jgi:hypothetical protein